LSAAIRWLWEWLAGTRALARRELLSLFVTPLAYLVATLFLLDQGWNFSLLLRFLNDPLAAPGPVMQFYFGGSFFIFWLPVIFISSAISMRLVAEERRQGTLEALLTAPLRPSQVIVGKFLGAYTFYILLWLPTGVFYVLLRSAGAGSGVGPELGPILSGYLGTALVGASFLAIGVLASTLARNQLAAALGTFVTCSITLLAGLLVDQVDSETISGALEWSSLLVMMQELAQGIVDVHWVWLHLGIVAAAIAVAVVVVDPRRNWHSIVRAALFVVFAGHLAVFAGGHSERHDWTRGRVYTLSDRARDVLGQLHGPIDVAVVVPSTIGGGRPNPLRAELHEVLMRMGKETPALRVRLIDPDRDRQEAERLLQDFGLAGRELADGVVLIRAGQGAELRRAHLLPSDLVTYATGPDVQVNGPRVKAFRGEEALLGKFLEVSEEERVRVCYTQGHGEPAFDDLEPFAGYAHLKDLLTDANLEVRLADLDVGSEGLSECDVLMIAGPQGLMPQDHVRVVAEYAEGGGAILLMSGAVVLRGATGMAHHGLEPLTASRGIHFGDRMVLDPHVMPASTPLLAFTLDQTWGEHPVTRSLLARPVSFMTVRELRVEEPAQVLVSVGEEGWAESGVHGSQHVFDEGRDRRGPIPVAAAAELGASRMVVIASDQFALNHWLREDVAYDHGRDLILNSIGWLTQREVLLGIRAREREHVKLVLQEDQLTRMTLLCLVGLPLFAMALGFIVLWRRR
jgi:ABC-2 type transport system permease protein